MKRIIKLLSFSFILVMVGILIGRKLEHEPSGYRKDHRWVRSAASEFLIQEAMANREVDDQKLNKELTTRIGVAIEDFQLVDSGDGQKIVELTGNEAKLRDRQSRFKK